MQKRIMRALQALALCTIALTHINVSADEWARLGTISPSTTLQANHLCYTDGTDLACSAPSNTLILDGTISATAFIGDGSGLTGVSSVSTLASLTDVNITSPVSGSILQYNASSSEWVNVSATSNTALVAFTAVKTSTQTTSGTWEIIEWESELTDTANAFNLTTNQFVAPVDGTYYFDFTMINNNATNANSTRIYKNGVDTNLAGFSSLGSTHTYRQASNGGVLTLSANDTVDVRFADSGATIYGTSTNYHTRFSGFLLSGGGGSSVSAVNDLSDVSTAGATTGQTLAYNGSSWVVSDTAASISALNDIGDVTAASPILGDTLQWNGSAWNAVSASSVISGSQVAFRVHRNGVDQTTSGVQLIDWTTEDYDTNNDFDLSTERFTPTVPGKYLFIATTTCSNTGNNCQVAIRKNGADMARHVQTTSTNAHSTAHTSTILEMNGSTDYVDATGYNIGTQALNGDENLTYFAGALINAFGNDGSSSGANAINDLTDGVNDALTSPYNLILGHAGSTLNANSLHNTAVGVNALNAVADSDNSGGNDSDGDQNTAVGYAALAGNTSGHTNTAIGLSTLVNNSVGYHNTAVGSGAMVSNLVGTANSSLGLNSLYYNQTGSYNTALGQSAAQGSAAMSITGTVAIGYSAGVALDTGADYNTLLGYAAGDNITTGGSNIIIGTQTDAPSATGDNQLNIGNTIYGNLSTGSVGIGANAATSLLQLSRSQNALTYMDLYNTNTGASAGGIFRMITSDVADTGIAIASLAKYGSGGFVINNSETDTAGYLSLNLGGSERVRIDSAGEVGIGTTNPSSDLHILGTSSDTVSQENANLNIEGAGGNGMVIGTLSSSPYSTYLQSGFVDNFGTATYPIALNPSGGNVGIGTTTPATPLYVEGAAQFAESSASVVIQSIAGIPTIYGWNGDLSNAHKPLSIRTTPGDQLYLDTTGYVGVGTNSPSSTLHVINSGVGGLFVSGSGNATARIENTVDVGGDFLDIEPKTTGIDFEVNDTDVIHISENAWLGVGTTSNPHTSNGAGKINILQNSGTDGINLRSDAAGNHMINLWRNGTGGFTPIAFYSGTTQTLIGSIGSDGSSVTYNTTSDYRLKENITSIEDALGLIDQIQPKTYSFKTDEAGTLMHGFIAHELQEIIPYAVTGEKDAVDAEGKPIYQQVDYAKLTPLLVKSIQELKTENDTLKARLQSIEERLNSLENK